MIRINTVIVTWLSKFNHTQIKISMTIAAFSLQSMTQAKFPADTPTALSVALIASA
jgi:hypothetical protein